MGAAYFCWRTRTWRTTCKFSRTSWGRRCWTGPKASCCSTASTWSSTKSSRAKTKSSPWTSNPLKWKTFTTRPSKTKTSILSLINIQIKTPSKAKTKSTCSKTKFKLEPSIISKITSTIWSRKKWKLKKKSMKIKRFLITSILPI